MHNPWQHLADHHPDVDVVWTRLPGDMRGCTDGATVWMDTRLTQAQRRSVLCHETIHIERGTYPVCEAEERIVDRLCARRLVELDDLVHALQDDPHQALTSLAARLWVTVEDVRCRLGSLEPWELADIENRLDLEWGAA
ncbi:MAG: hypothetical protein INR66_21405 [Gordonia polyisoprenivorans]|nr:hypothetical protein [Gordonia polyisoprenivorans]